MDNITGGENSQHQGPGAGTDLVHLNNREKASAAGTW